MNRVLVAGLRAQGFTCSIGELPRLRPWLRVAPAVTLVGAVLALALDSVAGFTLLAGISWACHLLGNHPADLFYNLWWRRWTGAAALPRYPAPRRFACGVAAGWLGLIAVFLAAGLERAATLAAAVLVFAALLVIATDWCLGALLYHLARRLSRDPGR
jgi:Domain of unknown function (DUF4395)